jgi:hypothetical protein
MRRTLRTILLAGATVVSLMPAAAHAKKDCVWYDVKTPVWTDADEHCTPDVLPTDLNENHQPEDCNGVPPAQTEWCVGGNVWLKSV